VAQRANIRCWFRASGRLILSWPPIAAKRSHAASSTRSARRTRGWCSQADILRERLESFLASPRLCGAFIWQFCDVRVDEAWAMSRPDVINDKGMLDVYRRPRMAYGVVKELFWKKRATL
jgi:hypothetical protein